MAEELKSCPFCGSKAEQQTDGTQGYWIECSNSACGCSTTMRVALMDDVSGMLADAWNRRTQPAESAGQLTDEARGVANQMANVMFNLAQKAGHALTSDDCAMFDRLRKEWDAARSVRAQQDGSFGIVEVLQKAESALASCYQVTEWPADGSTAQDEALAAVRAALKAAQAPGWMPIETAPKDGTQLILTNGHTVAQGSWVHEEPYIRERRDINGCYLGQDESDGFNDWMDCAGGMQPAPTHWQPLPAAPTLPTKAEGQEGGA